MTSTELNEWAKAEIEERKRATEKIVDKYLLEADPIDEKRIGKAARALRRPMPWRVVGEERGSVPGRHVRIEEQEYDVPNTNSSVVLRRRTSLQTGKVLGNVWIQKTWGAEKVLKVEDYINMKRYYPDEERFEDILTGQEALKSVTEEADEGEGKKKTESN